MNLSGRIIQLLTTHRLPLSDEKLLQAEIAGVFSAAGLAYRREVHLGPRDIVDFMVGSVAVEIKIKGARRAIYRQLERYCNYTEVGAIVLATNVPMSLPATILTVPTAIAALGRGWL